MNRNSIDCEILSDAELVVLLREGHEPAFIEIFSRFRILLLSFACRRMDDREIAKDLIHDAFADIWDKRLTINIPGNLRPFLITVIKNRILDHYKHQKVSKKYLEHFQTYLQNLPDNADYQVRHNDLSEVIEKEIAALPPKMRVVFELSRKAHLNRKEISDNLGIPENTVRINMNRALKILKRN